jgi:transaldolase
MERPETKILVDGGDPGETLRMRGLLGYVDGQTTNPSLIASNPGIKLLLAAGNRLSARAQLDEYKKIVEATSPLVGDAGISIEVFSDLKTTAEEMLAQGKEMYKWAPNAYIKYPCTTEGLKAVQASVELNMRVNVTLCFSQQQAAAVYAATRGSRTPVYVSLFLGRLDDVGQNGLDLVKNVKRMFARGDGHALVLAASIRTVDQLLCCFHEEAELATVPVKVLDAWAKEGVPLPGNDFECISTGQPIAFEELNLERPWQAFDIDHELTRKGLERFVADYKKTIAE